MKKTVAKYVSGLVGFLFLFFYAGLSQAAVYELLEGSMDSYVVEGALFAEVNVSGQGSGAMDPFVRSKSGQPSQIDIINTSTGPYTANTEAGTFTHDIQLGGIPRVSVNKTSTNGIAFNQTALQILFDSNQTGGNPTISIDQIFVFSRSTAYTGNTPTTSAGLLADPANTLRFNLDARENNSLIIDAIGSGAADMYLFLPTNLFAGVSNKDFLYFSVHYGDLRSNNAGFEEIGVDTSLVVIPEPSTYIFGFLIFGTVLWLERSKIIAIARKFALHS